MDNAIAGDSNHGGKGKWLALAAALLGWMFDGAEMGVFSMVGRSAVKELLAEGPGGVVSEGTVSSWFGIITALFLIGAATGGVLFGWLGDRIGRVRAMTLSVLVYALFTGLCGFVGEAWQLGALRFIASLGMGGEWSLGVALVMEVWPNKSRAFMAGLIGAAANVGYLLVGVIGLGLAGVLLELGTLLGYLGLSEATVHHLVNDQAQGWRIMMMLGTLPALLTFFIRIFVPESEKWQHEQESGGTSMWQTQDLLGVLIGALGPAAIIYLWAPREVPYAPAIKLGGTLLGLIVATGGYIYPVIRFLQRQSVSEFESARAWRPIIRRMLLAAALAGVALLGTWAAAQWAPTWANELTKDHPELNAKYYVQMTTAVGAIVGTILAAMMGDWLGRRVTYCLLCILSIGSLLWFYQGNDSYGTKYLITSFLAGGCTASFYGWLPLYLPELFHTNVRATGQGFGFNFGRIIAAVGALQTGTLFAANDVAIGSWTFKGGYPFACSAMSAIYLVGIVIIWFAPETRGKPLPE
jgi:MFS family permease